MSGQLVELKNTVKIKKRTILELKECLCKKDSENEHLKSKLVDFTMVQNLRAQVKELQSENKHLKSKVVDCTMCQNFLSAVKELKSANESLYLSVEDISRARALAERLCEKVMNVFWSCKEIVIVGTNNMKKYFALKETESLKVEIKSLQTENKVLKLKETELINLQKVYDVKASELLEKIEQMKSQVSELLEKLKISDQEMKQQIILLK
ncbi:hypothetical protein Tco_0213779 [Tanacetum coccineum]